ncbi:MAG: cyclic nucleotide-binding domain-containing protein [Alphaproteobacteria bacterium]|nr:cyclic nucleotide-binding domain-containing protein [Alphaproteobacteria bacterium]MCB9797465.1 cyclic nucleotide-binding domain-containing protein [Alphaproteobacteria bacterium]
MKLSIHAVSEGATPDALPSTQGLADPSLGLAASADATVRAHLLERDVGNAACRLALDTVRAQLEKNRDRVAELGERPGQSAQERMFAVLKTAFAKASKEVDALARRRDAHIQLTLDVVIVSGEECVVAHVGDGRVYLCRQGLMHVLTQDHLSADPTPIGAQRPTLTHGLGSDANPDPETLAIRLSEGDRLLLLSPWLHRSLDELALREASEDPVPDGATARMLGIARGGGNRQDLSAALLSVGKQTTRPEDTRSGRLATLARIPLFAYCTERELLAIAGLTRPTRYPAGQPVFQERDLGQAMYLVVSGRLAVVKGGREISRLAKGAFFGEMSMLDQPRRSATVRSLEDSELLVITRDAFFALLKRDPTLAVKVLWNMLRHVSARLRTTSDQLARLSSGSSDPSLH